MRTFQLKNLKLEVVHYFVLQCLVLIGFYWQFLTGEKQFFVGDTTNYFQPLCRFIGETLRQGRLALWNPYSGCGMSLAAISSPGLFFLPHISLAVLPFSQALAWIMILSQAVCGLGGFLLISSLGWGSIAALICALALALSGYMFSLTHNYTLVASASWFPLLIWSIKRANNTSGSNSAWSSALTSLCIFMMITAGRPEIWFPGLVAATFYALYACRQENEAAEWKSILFYNLRAFLIGILLALPTILPALEWLPLSRRAGGLVPREILMFSANWYDFLCMVVPQPLGDLQSHVSPLLNLVQSHALGRHVSSSYIGVFIAALAILGLQKKGSLLFGLTLFFTIAFTLMALGSNVPFAEQMVLFIPGASVLRFPSKLLFFCTFGVVLLAGRGIRNYLQDGLHLTQTAAIWLIAIAISTAIYFSNNVILPFNPVAGMNAAIPLAAQKLIACSTGIWSLLALLLVLALWWLDRKNMRQIGAIVACLCCAAALLFDAFSFYRFGAGPAYFQIQSPIADKLTELAKSTANNSFARFAPFYVQRFTVPPSFMSKDSLNARITAAEYNRVALNGFTNINFRRPSIHGYEGATVGDFFFTYVSLYGKSSQYVVDDARNVGASLQKSDIPIARFLQLTACPFALTQVFREGRSGYERVAQMDPQFFQLVFESLPLDVRIYRVANPLPRCYLSYNWLVRDDHEQVVDAIYNADKTGFDPRKTTLLERDQVAIGDSTATTDFAPVAIDQPQPELLNMHVKPDQPALLVLADQYYPGWTAAVDGHETEIWRCNGFMRAIYLKPGEHSVNFVYRPKSLYFGLLMAMLALVWQAVMLIRRRKPKDVQT